MASVKELPAVRKASGSEPAIRVGMAVLVLTLAGFMGWSALAPLSGAIIASGVVKVISNRKTIQHLEGGIVREILVRDGDVVKPGQSLVVLGSEEVTAAVELLEGQRDAAIARAARLNAERMLSTQIDFPANLTLRENEPNLAEIMSGERTYFQTRRKSMQTQVALLHQQAAHARSEVAALEGQIRAIERASRKLQTEIEAYEKLERDHHVDRFRVVNLERTKEDYASRAAEVRADMEAAQQRVVELHLRAEEMTDQYVKEAALALTDLQARIYDLEERLRPSRDVLKRQVVVAPTAGTIVGLRVFTPGGVIAPGDALMDIVPADDDLLIEARIDVQDIENVTVGQQSEVRLSAYAGTEYPAFHAEVVYVSADRFMDERDHTPYYLSHIRLKSPLGRVPADLKLRPGMTAEVLILTSERTVLEYLLQPLTDSLRRALRES